MISFPGLANNHESISKMRLIRGLPACARIIIYEFCAMKEEFNTVLTTFNEVQRYRHNACNLLYNREWLVSMHYDLKKLEIFLQHKYHYTTLADFWIQGERHSAEKYFCNVFMPFHDRYPSLLYDFGYYIIARPFYGRVRYVIYEQPELEERAQLKGAIFFPPADRYRR